MEWAFDQIRRRDIWKVILQRAVNNNNINLDKIKDRYKQKSNKIIRNSKNLKLNIE